MNKKGIFTLMIMVLFLPWIVQAAQPEKPNVIIFLADDLGWADVGYHGSPIKTPAIDRLATQGVRLERLYTTPICTPTRVGLMTGRDPLPQGLAYTQISPWQNLGVPLDEHFMAESFKAAGYQTGMIGKWHLGHSIRQYLPNARGFDYFYGHVNTAIDFYTHQRRGGHDWQRNGRSVDEKGQYVTDLEGNDAVRYIKDRNKEKPFFLYVPFTAPHNPMQAPDGVIEKYGHLPKANHRQVYAAMVDSMDSAIGNVLDTLDEERISDNTIVLFFSDNGGFNSFGADNSPLKGQKGQTYEGGIRVPAVLRWPSKLAGGRTVTQMLTVFDLFPTLASAAGVPALNTKPFDGKDMWAAIESGKNVPRDEDIFFISEVPVPGLIFLCVFHKEWKLVQIIKEGNTSTVVRSFLYRIEEDPNEARNLADKHPEIVDDLGKRINAWRSTHPMAGIRTTLVPHPSWLPPKDYADVVIEPELLQKESENEWLFNSRLFQAIGDRGRLVSEECQKELLEQEKARGESWKE